ncbi:MAG: acyltransferase family protein [Clostridia bacterium]|nr:acyltransferase family protein [Clostridia bacterium]
MENTQETLLNCEQLKDSQVKRQGGLDVFRIISMLMVVVHHVILHGGLLWTRVGSFNFYIVAFLETLCIIAVNCFALTSGFLNADKKIKIKNILNLYLQVLFFSVALGVGYLIFSKEKISLGAILKICLPIASNQYWYFSSYFLLFLFMPLLNIILNKADKKFLFVVIVFAVLFFGIYGFLGSYKFADAFSLKYGYSTIWLAILYVLGGVIKKLNIFLKLKSYVWGILFVVSTLLSFVVLVVMQKLKGNGVSFISSYCFLFNILSSCFLLTFFARVKIKPSKFLSVIAQCAFGVYLLHDNNYVRSAFITGKFAFLSDKSSLVLLLGVLGSAIAIFVIGTIVEFIRRLVFKLIRINKLTELIDNVLVKLYNKITIKEETIE